MSPVVLEPLVLLSRLAGDDRCADDDIAKQARRIVGQPIDIPRGEGQHVGWLVLLAIDAIQRPDILRIDDSNRDFDRITMFRPGRFDCCLDPGMDRRFRGYAFCVAGDLDVSRHRRHCHRPRTPPRYVVRAGVARHL